ncbi:MAG TPA: hypothetical protein VKY19_12985 [Ktedonosporobacter sp.]|jgi:CO dehydrogenase/acetyl-CoA synthase alpha subunit|nr:hypothetical protein [Ktedonosporobacter sp.]
MPIPKEVAPSIIELEQDEARHLIRLLLSHQHSQQLTPYITEVVEKVSRSTTIEIGGMCLAVLNATLNSIIADASTHADDVMRLTGILYKVQQQVHQGMAEILATEPLRLDRLSSGRP